MAFVVPGATTASLPPQNRLGKSALTDTSNWLLKRRKDSINHFWNPSMKPLAMHLEMPHNVDQVATGCAYMSKTDRFAALIEEARIRRDKLKAQLEAVEKVLSGFEELQRQIPADVFAELLERTPIPALEARKDHQDSRVSVSPHAVAEAAKSALLSSGRPMRRGELVKALLAKEVPLAGKDKNKNLGTILWRHPQLFVSIENLGYWIKGVPLDGIYDPVIDDEPLPKATFVKHRTR